MRSWARFSLAFALVVGAACRAPRVERSRVAAKAVDNTAPSRLPENAAAGELSLARWTAHQEQEERERRANYDRRRLAEHRALVALLEQARDRYDHAATKAALARAQARFKSMVPSIQARLDRLDRWGQSSQLTHDYAALLDSLSAPYATARLAELDHAPVELSPTRADVASRLAKIKEWLEFAATSEEE